MEDKKLEKIIGGLLKKDREQVNPSKELLTRILSKIEPVTEMETQRYLVREEIKGRPVISTMNEIMARWKYVIGAVVVGVVAGVLFMTQFKGSEPALISEKELTADENELVLLETELNLDFVEDPSFVEIDKSLDELLRA